MTPAQQTRLIIAEVAERHGITVEQIMGDSRKRHISWPRQEAMYELGRRSKWMSLTAIARFFGRDHTTILHGIRKHCERIGASYEDFSAQRRGTYWLTMNAFNAYGQAMKAKPEWREAA